MPARTARTYKIERESLEAHVDICAERYDRLEVRMDTLNDKVEKNSTLIASEASSTRKMVMGSAGTVIATLISIVVALVWLIKV
jgi:tRNA(Phe) wybutosine-synthesizing methylase Tyw3